MSWDENFHTLMLDDQIRMIAFHTAIAETVRPGMVVLDLGTGTGILALWALQAGAARVYGLDLNAPMLDRAKARISAAGYGNRFAALNALSYDATLPERVDLIVSEIMGNMGDNEDFVGILDDARQRFLKPGGIMLPRRVESYIVPTSAATAHARLCRGECCGFEPTIALDHMLERNGIVGRFNSYYDAILPQQANLATPRVLRSFAFEGTDATTYEVTRVFTVLRTGVFTGFKAYFVADLSDTVALDIASDDISNRMTSDSWKHCYLPVEEPVDTQIGDRITLVFGRNSPGSRDIPFRQSYRWSGAVHRGERVLSRFHQNMRRDIGVAPTHNFKEVHR